MTNPILAFFKLWFKPAWCTVIQIHHLKSIRKPYEYKDNIYNIFTIYAWNIYFFQDLWIRFTYAIKDKKIMKSEMKGGLGVYFMWKSTTTAKRYGVMKVRASEKGVKFESSQSCYYDTCASDQVSFQTKMEVFHLYHMELCIYTVHLVIETYDINQKTHCRNPRIRCRIYYNITFILSYCEN